MKKPIKLLSLAIATVAGGLCPLRADTGITVVSKDQSVQGFTFDDVKQISFSNGSMVVELAEKSESIALTDISFICFDREVSAQESIIADLSDGLELTVADGIATITMAGNAPLHVLVCTIDGKIITSVATTGSTSVDLRDQPNGAYIIKANNKLIKFTK